MGLLGGTGAIARTPDAGAKVRSTAPLPGAYLTDGRALFRVAHAMWDRCSGEQLLELEDCNTLETLLAPACAVAESALRSVTPTPAP